MSKTFVCGCVVEMDESGELVKTWVAPTVLASTGNENIVAQLTRMLPTDAPTKRLTFLADKMPTLTTV